MKLEEIKNQIKNLTDTQLKLNILEGESAYQEGVFTLYLDEASIRNINLEKENIEISDLNNNAKDGSNLVKLGYALGFLGGFGGYIIGLIIWFRKNKRDKKIYFYSQNIRKHTKWICIFTTIMIFGGWKIIGNLINVLMGY